MAKKRGLEIRPLLRLYSGNEFTASEGRIQLLENIAKEGSIKKAAEKMDMSYRHAWGMLKKMEESIGEKLLISERGGGKGGTSKLTPTAEDMIAYFREREGAVELAAKYGRKPSLSVDMVIIKDNKVVLVKRKNQPYKGQWVLPGGFVDFKETVEDAAIREAKEETNLDIELDKTIGVFSAPDRDPRGHTVSVAFLAHPKKGKLQGGDDAAEAKWFDMGKLPELGFDHAEILSFVTE